MFSAKNVGLCGLVISTTFIFLGYINVSLALAIGLILALVFGNPINNHTSKWSGWLLKTAVVGLGFGLPLDVVIGTAKDSFLLTLITIGLALFAGYWISRALGIDRTLSQLLSVGTAICGGSAIAAVAPVLRARSDQIAISLAVVFILNGVGLFVFPPIGHWLALSDTQFGIWAALAIHDTSSVVGAAADFSAGALPIATTAKLARAIWIVPLVLAIGLFQPKGEGKPGIPLFISLFLAASLLRTLFSDIGQIAPYITMLAKDFFAVSLLLIGFGLTRGTLKSLSVKPLIMAVSLWVILASTSLIFVINGWL